MDLSSRLFKGDRVIWIVFMFLCLISIIEVFSAASLLGYQSGGYWVPITRHVFYMIIGICIVLIIHNTPYHWFRIIPYTLFPLSILLLLSVYFIGETTNDASRWFNIGGFRFQPSELVKMSAVVTVALILSQSQTENGTSDKAFSRILIVSLISCFLIAPENLSTALLLFGVIYLIMWIGCIPKKQMLKLTAGIFIVGTIGVTTILLIPERYTKTGVLHRVETWKGRLNDFFVSEGNIPPAKYDIENNSQRAHANIAIATSHIIGKMPGNSVERDFLAQAFSDFIFAIIIEELGLLGGLFVVLLYIILFVRAGKIAKKCEGAFATFLIMGIALVITLQAFVNMMVAVGILPITGQTLPLISRGGTSLVVNCIYIGMLLSISRYVNQKEEEKAKEDRKTEENEILSAIPEEYQQIAE